MMKHLPIITAIYIAVSLVVFIIYGVDKSKARRHQWRIPEATLLLAAILSPVGALLGMFFFHHKTRKAKFTITVPLILIIEIVIIIYVIGGI